ncbi:MAG: Xaa-Pro peptidase family protein, partial [Bacteroidota bacterium]
MKISKSEYRQRVQALQAKVRKSKVDALIVSEEEDIYYLTGLTYKGLERLFLLIVRENTLSFILPQMELAHLEKVENVEHIITYWEYPAQAPERWQDILIKELGKGKYIGLGGKSPMEVSSCLGEAGFETRVCHFVEELRWIKSEREIQLIRRASAYCDLAIAKLNATAYYGMSELEVVSIGQGIQRKVIKELDFDYVASNFIVAAWPSRISYQPHGVPEVGDLLVEGSHISLAFLRVNGYSAELERTFFTQKPSAEQKEIFNIMLEARKRSYAVLKAGISGEEVDFASKHFLEKEGFKDNLMHRTGHGIGLGNHEGPYLAEGDKTILKENMV